MSDEIAEHEIKSSGITQWMRFNQLLHAVFGESVRVRAVLEKQNKGRIIAPMLFVPNSPQLLKLMRHLRDRLRERLANSGIAHASHILEAVYGLNQQPQSIEAIASELGVTPRDVETAHTKSLDYLRNQVGKEMFEQLIVGAARDTRPGHFMDR